MLSHFGVGCMIVGSRFARLNGVPPEDLRRECGAGGPSPSPGCPGDAAAGPVGRCERIITDGPQVGGRRAHTVPGRKHRAESRLDDTPPETWGH